MIITIFIILLSLSLIFIGLGYAVDVPLISIIGCVIIFGLGITMLNTDIEIKTGENTTNTLNVNGSIISTQTSIQYAPYDFGGVGNTPYGLLMMLLGAFLFIIVITTTGD